LLVPIVLAAIVTALLVWLLLGTYFTFSVFRPLTRITEATRRMARGDYGARVGARGHGDIAQLATSFNHMAQQVQSSNQVLRDFLANVSHDLRTPLTIITGFSEAMLDGTASGDAVEDSVEVIHQEALKMQHLVDDLMQLTRLESGLLRLDRHPIALQPLVQTLIDRTEMASKGTNIPQLRNAVPADLPPIDADPDQIERALRNLLGNAVQYTPAEGTVTVLAEPGTPGWIEISVTDTGPGIPADDLPRIFERFYRSDKSREREHGHSGLGLAIVREIVEAHGGRITAESEVGTGTQFRLTLPKAASLSASREAAETVRRAQQAV
jgi:signal transduction histidine kinase